MAKFRVERGGGEYVFPTLSIVVNEGDIIDLPADTDIAGLVPVADKQAKAAPSDNPPAADAASPEGV